MLYCVAQGQDGIKGNQLNYHNMGMLCLEMENQESFDKTAVANFLRNKFPSSGGRGYG